MAKVKVVYIVGSARSGSTLLTSLLGELDGFFAASEMRLIWHRMHERHCGCGLPVWSCPVWSIALGRVHDHVGPLEAADVIALQQATTRTRHLRRVLSDRELTPDLKRYGQVLSEMYQGIAAATGARVVVDSSKALAEAALLRHLPEIDPYVVHLLRDPRAVAYSWQRVARRKAQGPPTPVARLAAAWVMVNSASDLLVRRFGPERATRVRYEDFVTDPASVLGRIAAMAGEDPGDLSFLTQPDVTRTSRHMVGGNALRFGESVVQLRPDTEWSARLSSKERAQVTALALPLLRRYRYSVT